MSVFFWQGSMHRAKLILVFMQADITHKCDVMILIFSISVWIFMCIEHLLGQVTQQIQLCSL